MRFAPSARGPDRREIEKNLASSRRSRAIVSRSRIGQRGGRSGLATNSRAPCVRASEMWVSREVRAIEASISSIGISMGMVSPKRFETAAGISLATSITNNVTMKYAPSPEHDPLPERVRSDRETDARLILSGLERLRRRASSAYNGIISAQIIEP